MRSRSAARRRSRTERGPAHTLAGVTAPLRVGVLADDLIWSTRLVSMLREAGTDPVAVRTPAALDDARVVGAVIDLTARAYDGIQAVRAATGAGISVVCLAQHDDNATRGAALLAGARSVFPYRTLHEKGAAALARWLGELATAAVPR
jgi:DNA-binding NarL/FixJ family response regulator